MRRYITLLTTVVASFLLTTTLFAQTTQSVAGVFLNAPKEVILPLSFANKTDLIAQYKASLDKPSISRAIQTTILGQAAIDTLTQDYLKMHIDSLTLLQIKILPTRKVHSVICLIGTSLIKPAQSVIRFYDEKWEPLSMALFAMPRLDFYLNNPTDIQLPKMIDAQIDLKEPSFEIEAFPNSTDLRVKYTSLSPDWAREKYKALIPLFKPNGILYHWDSNHFVMAH